MKSRTLFGKPLKDILLAVGPSTVMIVIAFAVAYKYVDPAPPNHFVITTGSDEGDYQTFAKLYKDILKDDHVTLEIRPSSGALENLERLKDPKSGVDVGFVQDGLGSADAAPELASLGSLYYEPIWVFYRGHTEVNRFSQLLGKKVAVGKTGGGTRALALQLLKASGVDETNTQIISLAWTEAAEALRSRKVDAVIFLATPDEPLIKELVADSAIRLMNVDQAEAITRKIPFLHHLVLPHGAIDLKRNLPAQDVHMVSPTATLLVRDTLHPALAYLLLKAASQVHDDPGIFEKRDEFPIGKDYVFPLSDEAQHFYKSGAPFWQRYLPFWLASLADRFILLVIPLLAVCVPIVKLIPRYFAWRIRSRIYQRYGELKFLETQIEADLKSEKQAHYLDQLDHIEERVNRMKVPLDFSEHLYGLREHIDFVRARLQRKTKVVV